MQEIDRESERRREGGGKIHKRKIEGGNLRNTHLCRVFFFQMKFSFFYISMNIQKNVIPNKAIG